MKPSSSLIALLLLVPAPSVGVLTAMILLPGPIGMTIFGLCKVWVLLFPLLWIIKVDKQRPSMPPPRAAGVGVACVTGVLIFGAIVGAYFLVGKRWIDAEVFRARLREVGFETRMFYVALAVYWCTLNSILEEYVWRWFVFTRCTALMPKVPAVIVSGLLFTLHHAIALGVYSDWRVVSLACAGIWVGGAVWSWLYLRYRNIWAPYISHVFADVAVFGIGYVLIFE